MALPGNGLPERLRLDLFLCGLTGRWGFASVLGQLVGLWEALEAGASRAVRSQAEPGNEDKISFFTPKGRFSGRK